MDVTSTLNFFDKWFAQHKTTCGVVRLAISIERERDDHLGETTIKLLCPMCGNTISGRVRDDDWPHVVALLSDEKRN